MNQSRLLAKLTMALGMCFAMLAVGTSVSEAVCCEGVPTCNGTSPTGPGGCAAGACSPAGIYCVTCICGPDFFNQECYCR